METRILGNSEIAVSSLAFGGSVFGWTASEQLSFLLLDRFVDAGFTFIDTADVYSRWVPGHSGGESETILGKWLRRTGKRYNVVVATKVGMVMGHGKHGLSKSYLVRAIEDSLRRLQTDYIDLYQSHVDDRGTPLDETLEAYAQLLSQGKVRAIGASNYGADRLSAAINTSIKFGYPSFQTLQPLYNLYDRHDYELELEPVCRELGLGVITYFSLASGFLTGKYRSHNDLSKSARGQVARKYLNARGYRILRALDEVATTHGSTVAAVSLAWLIGRPTVTAAIASATSLEQLEELIQGANLSLDKSSTELLNRSSEQQEAV